MTADATRRARISQDLIVRYVAGDRDAFQAVFEELSRDVYFVVRRLFQSAFDQEEAQQEVWLHLYRMRRQVDVNRPKEFVGWVRRVARNRAIDLLKARGRRREIPVEEIGDIESDDRHAEAAQPKALAERRLRALIDTFVEGLDDEKRAFFPLCFVEERSHPEIAERLAMTVRRSKYLKKILLAQLLEVPGLREHLE